MCRLEGKFIIFEAIAVAAAFVFHKKFKELDKRIAELEKK